MYRLYKDRVTFFVVYIQEAHPVDLWQMPVNLREGVLFASPRSALERSAVALACVRNLDIQLPALVDSLDNRAERAYTAWPDRIYLIGRGGRVAFKSEPGPFGFRVRDLEQSLESLIRAGGNRR